MIYHTIIPLSAGIFCIIILCHAISQYRLALIYPIKECKSIPKMSRIGRHQFKDQFICSGMFHPKRILQIRAFFRFLQHILCEIFINRQALHRAAPSPPVRNDFKSFSLNLIVLGIILCIQKKVFPIMGEAYRFICPRRLSMFQGNCQL